MRSHLTFSIPETIPKSSGGKESSDSSTSRAALEIHNHRTGETQSRRTELEHSRRLIGSYQLKWHTHWIARHGSDVKWVYVKRSSQGVRLGIGQRREVWLDYWTELIIRGGVNDNPWAKVSESDPQCPTAYLGALVRFLMTCICIHTSRGFKYGCLQPSGFEKPVPITDFFK